MRYSTMPIKRVLAVHSLRDHTVEDRIRALAGRPGLQGIDIRHAFIFGPEEERTRSEDLSLKPFEIINKNERRIFSRLADEITAASPDLCVLHTGVAFHFSPRVIMSIFSNLKRRHPSVLFGIQEGGGLTATLKKEGSWLTGEIDRIFDQAEGTKRLVALLF